MSARGSSTFSPLTVARSASAREHRFGAYSAGVRSTFRPCRASRSAVAGPTHAELDAAERSADPAARRAADRRTRRPRSRSRTRSSRTGRRARRRRRAARSPPAGRSGSSALRSPARPSPRGDRPAPFACGLRPRTRDALAEQRPRVEPAQVLAQGDQTRRRPESPGGARSSGRPRCSSRRACQPARLLRRQRAVVDDRGRVLRGSAVRDQRVQHLGELLRSGVADERAIEARQAASSPPTAATLPSSSWPRMKVSVSPPPGIGDRDARIARHARCRQGRRARLEANALLVEEQRLAAAAGEDEGVAPLQPGDGPPLARLLGEEDSRSLPARAAAARRRRRRSSPRPGAPSAAGAAARDGRRPPRPPTRGTAGRGRSGVPGRRAGADQVDDGHSVSVASHSSRSVSSRHVVSRQP